MSKYHSLVKVKLSPTQVETIRERYEKSNQIRKEIVEKYASGMYFTFEHVPKRWYHKLFGIEPKDVVTGVLPTFRKEINANFLSAPSDDFIIEYNPNTIKGIIRVEEELARLVGLTNYAYVRAQGATLFLDFNTALELPNYLKEED